MGSIPGLVRSSGGGHGNPLQYSRLKNPMDRGSWQAIVHRITESATTGQLTLTLTHTHTHTHTQGPDLQKWSLKENSLQFLGLNVPSYFFEILTD